MTFPDINTINTLYRKKEKWPSPATLAGIAESMGIEPYDLMKPENTSAQDIRKITDKLIKDITSLVNQSEKNMNTIIRESNKK